MNLDEMATFIAVVEAGSMKAAAQRLGVPTSTVSRRVARLEDGLGLALLHRAHRTFTLTEHGEHLFERCGPIVEELGEVVTALSDRAPEPRGRLRVTLPQDLGATAFFADVMAGFMARWPLVSLDVELTNRRVSLVEEGFDVALRAHGPTITAPASLMVRRLGVSAFGLYASPAYLAQRTHPESPEALLDHKVLSHGLFAHDAQMILRPRERGEAREIAFDPTASSNDFGLLLELARADAGICALPDFLAGPGARSGTLCRVLPGWSLEGGHFSLLWPRSRHLAPRVRAFIDHVSEAIEANGDFQSAGGPR